MRRPSLPPGTRSWLQEIERELWNDPRHIAFTQAVKEIIKDARLPWWAFLRKNTAHTDRKYILEFARLGAWEAAARCAHGIGADAKAVRAVAALIYG